jgi:hypothetical protein
MLRKIANQMSANQRTLDLAAEEASRRGDSRTGTEHLLLTTLRAVPS